MTFPVMGTGYGAVHQAGAVHHRRGSGQGGGLLRARAAVAAALCLSGLAALLAYQAGHRGLESRHAVALEEEIGSFGTALNGRQVEDADAEFEDEFGEDPGHVSRGEIRFNAALRALGGRNPAYERRHRARFSVERRPNLAARWTAIPEPEEKKPAKVEVKVVEAPAPAPVSRLGMSDSEARNDLNSYFSTLSQQVKDQEKKHAEQVLGELSGDSANAEGSSGGGSNGNSARQSLSGAKTHVQQVADQKVSALMKLVKKAAASKQFQEALVDASRDTYRGSVVDDFE